jgi:hypothetical protein
MAADFNPKVSGGATGPNLAAFFLQYVLFDGKFRGLFSIMFGADDLRKEREQFSGSYFHVVAKRAAVAKAFHSTPLYLNAWDFTGVCCLSPAPSVCPLGPTRHGWRGSRVSSHCRPSSPSAPTSRRASP